MLTRRQFAWHTKMGLAAMVGLQACSMEESTGGYEQAVQSTWRHGLLDVRDKTQLGRELVRYATLAPSSHNTQCWKFRLSPDAVMILPDLSRRCPAVDPDDHHLWVSLGCAAENLVQAASAHGLKSQVNFDRLGNDVKLVFDPTTAVVSPLFQAIPQRQCTRAPYDGKALSNAELTLLQQVAAAPGVELKLLTERSEIEKTLEYVIQGNTAQMNDPAFVSELKAWLRFSSRDAVRSGDGLYAASSGNPSLPAWLGSPMFDLVFKPTNENDKYAKQLRSSAGVAVFAAESADAAHWFEVGRCYQRFALQATTLGVRNAFVNQPVEVASLRPQFAHAIGLGPRRTDLVVRFGRGPLMPYSLRRPLQAVIV